MEKLPDPLSIPHPLIERDEIDRKVNRETRECQEWAAKEGIEHRGWRFFPPYCCGRCGDHVSAAQFCHGRGHGLECGGEFSSYDRRWFIMGRVVDERTGDSLDINPEFVSVLDHPPAPRRPRRVPPRPRPKPIPRPMRPTPRKWR